MTDADLPDDYDKDDGMGDHGLEQCPRCETQLGGQGGTHGPVYDPRGRRFESLYDTDPAKGPYFCPDCWDVLDRNRKRAENNTLEDYA